MAVASLIWGMISLIIGVLLGWCIGWLGILLAVLGIVFGALGRRKPLHTGMATAGLVMSVIALAFSVFEWIAFPTVIKNIDLMFM